MKKSLYSRLLVIEKNCQGIPEPLLAWEAIEPLLPVFKVMARKTSSPDSSCAAELVAAYADRFEYLTNLSTPALKLLLREITLLAA